MNNRAGRDNCGMSAAPLQVLYGIRVLPPGRMVHSAKLTTTFLRRDINRLRTAGMAGDGRLFKPHCCIAGLTAAREVDEGGRRMDTYGAFCVHRTAKSRRCTPPENNDFGYAGVFTAGNPDWTFRHYYLWRDTRASTLVGHDL